MDQYTSPSRGGLGKDATGWLTEHGWRPQFHDRAVAAAPRNREVPDHSRGVASSYPLIFRRLDLEPLSGTRELLVIRPAVQPGPWGRSRLLWHRVTPRVAGLQACSVLLRVPPSMKLRPLRDR